MKIRSLIVPLTLAVIAGGAVASDVTGGAAHRTASPLRAIGTLTADDMRPLTAMYVPGGELAAIDMPKCADCH